MPISGKAQDLKKAQKYFEARTAFTMGPVELNHLLEGNGDVNVVDLRTAEDFAKGHIPGAINLPKDKWDLGEGLKKDKINVLYCYSQTCHLAPNAGAKFSAQGYPVMEMEGGYAAWEQNNFNNEQAPQPESKKTVIAGVGPASGSHL